MDEKINAARMSACEQLERSGTRPAAPLTLTHRRVLSVVSSLSSLKLNLLVAGGFFSRNVIVPNVY